MCQILQPSQFENCCVFEFFFYVCANWFFFFLLFAHMKIFVTFSVTNLKCAWALNSFVSQRQQQLQQQLQRVVVVVVDAAVALHRCAKLQTSIIFHCVISLRSGELFYQSQSHRYVCLYVSVLNVLDIRRMYVDVCVRPTWSWFVSAQGLD